METATANPLREGLPRDRVPEPATLVIFGVTGDLTHRKLIPAIYRLYVQRLLPESFAVVGVARREWGDGGLRDVVKDSITKVRGSLPPASEWRDFDSIFHYVQGEFDDSETYVGLGKTLDRLEKARGGAGDKTGAHCNRLY